MISSEIIPLLNVGWRLETETTRSCSQVQSCVSWWCVKSWNKNMKVQCLNHPDIRMEKKSYVMLTKHNENQNCLLLSHSNGTTDPWNPERPRLFLVVFYAVLNRDQQKKPPEPLNLDRFGLSVPLVPESQAWGWGRSTPTDSDLPKKKHSDNPSDVFSSTSVWICKRSLIIQLIYTAATLNQSHFQSARIAAVNISFRAGETQFSEQCTAVKPLRTECPLAMWWQRERLKLASSAMLDGIGSCHLGN